MELGGVDKTAASGDGDGDGDVGFGHDGDMDSGEDDDADKAALVECPQVSSDMTMPEELP